METRKTKLQQFRENIIADIKDLLIKHKADTADFYCGRTPVIWPAADSQDFNTYTLDRVYINKGIVLIDSSSLDANRRDKTENLPTDTLVNILEFLESNEKYIWENNTENIVFKDIHNDPNNFSFWFHKIKDCGIPVPESKIFMLPNDVVRSLVLDREGDDERITEFVRSKVLPFIPKDWSTVFVKNGTYSGKSDFRNCCIKPSLHCLVTSLEGINQRALCLDAGGQGELVIRKYLPATPCKNTKVYHIYNGMPLRPEIRVFFDFDRGKALYAVNYWDWNSCHEIICGKNSTDALAYKAAWPALKQFFKNNAHKAMQLTEKHLSGVDLKGIWAVDLMWHENKFWLIDMAEGKKSFYYDPKKIKKTPKNAKTNLTHPATGKNKITAYTDGGYYPKKKKATYAYVLLQKEQVVFDYAATIPDESNNRAELIAILEAVNRCPKRAEIEVCSDSQYAIQTLSGKWSRKKNTDLFERWEKILAEKNCKVSFKWIKGHSGNRYNEMCHKKCSNLL